ncbi:MAG TPA: DNA polymerase III subunit gamma/tau C-terminal domain-containing protein [Candidatus Competibacter sp.]|nr:DNA polymerase III subunit gamma/tau C-terminal domain-containing protein [Candidatus Competibacter sp.]
MQLFYQIAPLGRRDLPLAPDPRGGFEMVLLRMLCFRPEGVERPARASESAHREPVAVPAPPAQPVQAPVAAPPPGSSPARPISEWSGLVEQLGLGGMAKQLALNCALVSREGNHFRLALEPIHAQMLNKTSEERLKVALEQQLGTPVDLRFQVSKLTVATPADQRQQQQAERQQVAIERVNQDPMVRDIQETFEARIVAVHPLDDTDV